MGRYHGKMEVRVGKETNVRKRGGRNRLVVQFGPHEMRGLGRKIVRGAA